MQRRGGGHRFNPLEKFDQLKSDTFDYVDINDDGKIDIQDIIIHGLRVPGIRIDRNEFLEAELKQRFDESVVQKAIATTPAQAGITIEQLDPITDQVIQFERTCVSGIAAVLGAPGGFAMVATIPADIIQYYGYMLRAAQKLFYLYGFQQIDVSEEKQAMDSTTMNVLIICLGTMYGVAGAKNALLGVCNALAKGVEKQLIKAALTKGTIYPIVKKTAQWFGVKMTKSVFAGFFKKAIPVVGGVLGGGLTYLSFKPCCDRLKDTLKTSILADPQQTINKDTISIVE